MTAPLLTIDALSVTIHGKRILDTIDLTIAPGEIVALTGESGSGKSMTALATMGLLPQVAQATGQISLDGTDLLTLPERRLCAVRGNDIGMIFQEPMTALNPVQTIGAQVAETILQHSPRTPRAMARDKAREALHRCGLDLPLTRYPHELSGGQRQRVVIAMAIALRPRLLIADEPTTALDVTTQAQILDLLQDLTRTEGMALMMITHDLAVVANMAHRIAVMQTGRIVESGPTAQVLSQRTHPYTRALFEASDHRPHLPPRPDNGPLLHAQGVTCTYPLPRPGPFAKRPSFTAVRDVSFHIGRGERVGLVGESGCGKSTLTRALLGLTSIAEGTITLGGKAVFTDHRPNLAVRRRIQVVFQDPYGSFNPRHRVARLITEPFHLLPDPPQGTARDTAVAEALTAVGLSPDDAHKHIHAFSGGQRQRLAIARALIIRPDLIVFDEAVSALDVRVRAQILDLMADLSASYGLAYLFISHDLSVVRGVTDRIMVMRAGRIVEKGPTEQVFTAPRHAYTRTLLDAAPHLPASPGGA
ncbi:ABC transporter ATP-binding protein [Antarctobacter heliothermus]|uniref:Peptide/nickel transport system ATP-binding protein n=1 Tax=Antarctobacter heliothermus TaxID=74033 RepID=A0A239BGZ0_9RHOB|nr:dipeptide ABC transporter ATP-binding protein [Antarctobacter heliothermus]SNS07066.1 peptide/nickel transport system ATP-binding protein [Antarctobacter heliothermus]